MTFIDPGERLIIMDFGGALPDVPSNLLTLDELKALAGVGVKTIYYQGGFRWDMMQPTSGAPIDWGCLDNYIERIEAANLRCLIPFVHTCPPWEGPDWFLGGFITRQPGSTVPPSPSYTNSQTAADLDELLLQAIWRYSGRAVQFVYAIPIEGEFAFPLVPNRSEPEGFTAEHFIQWVVDRQQLFAEQYNEVWTAYHLIDSPSWADAMYSRLRAEFPDCAHYAIQFTHWYHAPYAIKNVDDIISHHKIRYFCGSEYCQGLLAGAVDLAIGHNTGLLTSPIALHCGGGRLQPWQLDALRGAIRRFENVPQPL